MRGFVFWFSVVATLALASAYVLLSGIIASAVSHCAHFAGDPTMQAYCAYVVGAQQPSTVKLGLGLSGLGALTCFLSWFLGIVDTSRTHRWGWFTAVLLLTPLATLIYGLRGPDQPPRRRPQMEGYRRTARLPLR